MSVPSTPPPPVTYVVTINSEEPNEYKTPANASKYVAENIFVGHWAAVEFKDAADIKQVRENFNARMETWLRQVGHTEGFWCLPTAIGANYRLRE